MSAPVIEREPRVTPSPVLFPQDRATLRPATARAGWRAPQHQRPRRAGRLPDRSAVRGRTTTVAALGLVLLVVAAGYLANLAGWPAWFDDEGTYYSQAWALQNLGTLAPYTYWYDHPPVGWLQLALFTWLPDLLLGGAPAILSGRVVVVGYVVATAALVFVLARRLGVARGWALAAVAAWALNPLALYWGRQVLLDNVALPWLLGAFVLAMNRRRHLGHHMLAGLCFGTAVLTKETVLIMAPAVLLAVWQSSERRTRAFAVVGFSMMTALCGALYLVYAAIRSELLPGDDHVSVVSAVQFQLSAREGSGFLLDPSTADGGAYGTLMNWLDQDPYLLLAGVGLSLPALFVRRLRPVALAVLLAVVVALRPDGYLPGMYVIAVLPFCALLVAGMLDVGWRALHDRRGKALRAVAWVALAGLAAALVGPVQEQRERWLVALERDENAVHAAALQAVQAEVPDGATVVVDNTYWNDLVDAGRDPEDVVWFYKVDSDPAVTEELGGDFEGVEYLLWTREAMSDLAPIVKEAYDSSDVVWAAGEGDARVELRRTVTAAEQEERERAKASLDRREFALEMRVLDLYLAADSGFGDLTNGQVEALRSDAEADDVGPAELAERYGTTTDTVTEVLEDAP